MSDVRLAVPFCGLPCPPLRLEFRDGGCAVCRAAVEAPAPAGPPLVEGKPVSLEAAVARASETLRAARRPVVFGLAHSACGTARIAAAIAARLRGAIDVEGSSLLQPEIDVLQSSGGCFATFGAIRSSADVVLLWRVDPRAAHPELFGDAAETPARRFIHLTDADTGGNDLEAALVLRALVSGRAPRAAAFEDVAGALRAARYAAIVHGTGWREPAEGRAVLAALHALAGTLLETRRAAVVSLGAGGNVAGAMAALLSSCGLPRAVSFHDGSARPVGRDTMDADALLLVGALGRAPATGGPVVVVGPGAPPGPDSPEVIIPTAVPALSERGVWLRADGVPVTLTAPVASDLPREGDVLRLLLDVLETA
jgi:formylmethanofuran dehydrogenase subunit B